MINIIGMWRIRGRGTTGGGLAVGTTISLKLGLQPEPSGDAGYASWQGGDFTKSDDPQGRQPFCQANGTLMINMGQMVPEYFKWPGYLSPPLRQAPRCAQRPRGDLQGAWQRLGPDLAAAGYYVLQPCTLGRGTTDGGLRDGAILNPTLGLQANRPASRTRTPTPERSEWGTIFPGLLVEQSASKVSGPTNPPRGCREGRKAAPCTLRGENNDTESVASVKTIRERVSNTYLLLPA